MAPLLFKKKSLAIASVFAASCFILFTVFLVTKIDGGIDWSWPRIFSPLWSSLVLYMWIAAAMCFRASRWERLEAVLGVAAFTTLPMLCIIIFTALLSAKLDGGLMESGWVWIFIPVWTGLGILSVIDGDFPNWKHEFHKDVYDDTSDFRILLRLTYTCWNNVLVAFAIFFIVLVLHLSELGAGICTNNWPMCFLPFWIAFFLPLFVLFSSTIESAYDDSNWDLWLFLPVGGVVIWIFSFFLLLVLYLQGIIPLLTYAFIPVFIAQIIWFCISFCLPCIL
eukprot:TRINITY_DN13176_c0_g1_i1.p1 TRINITY_DN13176_c0_g1~~TRINITY_DN13176_c0_g1_i1.p1  ORF type:complete len:290 (-),score=8.39 TRINITY_DN13176_c0_g1_i1:41-880(-)